MRKFLAKSILIFLPAFILVAGAYADSIKKVKSYDGIITQVNYGDGSFAFRLRDGNVVVVKSPIVGNIFINLKGVFDPTQNTIDSVSEFKIKNSTGADAIPNISLMNPGSGQVGTKIILNGTGFAKKNNSINIGDIKNAIIGLPAKDGKTLTFQLPSAPCNQKTKTACPTTVLTPGTYNFSVVNESGVSNGVPFTVTPLPLLTINTDLLPQVVGNTEYKASILATGGAESYNWRVTDGRLPPGLILARGACSETPCRTPAVISGVPTLPGTYQFTVTLTSGQENISRQFSIVVVQPLSNPY